MLIEMGGDAQPALLPQIKAEPSLFAAPRPGTSPTENAAAALPGWSRQPDHSVASADGGPSREFATAFNATEVATRAS